MSLLSRRRRSERSGRTVVVGSNGTLPRAELRRYSVPEGAQDVFDWGMGQSPMSALLRGSVTSAGRVFQPSSAKRFLDGRFKPVLTGLSVRYPTQMKFCVQRKERREVLFAKRVAGRRGGSPGPYKRREWSNWRC